MSGFNFDGMKQLQQQLKRQEQDFERFIRQFLLKMALEAVNRAKANTPVDTGLLRAAWAVEGGISAARGRWDKGQQKMVYSEDEANSQAAALQSVQRMGNSLVVTIINPVEYASFVEYGHATKDRNGWVNGRFMATLAIDEVAQLIPAQFQKEYAAWLRSLQ